jgi:hypothetical protein
MFYICSWIEKVERKYFVKLLSKIILWGVFVAIVCFLLHFMLQPLLAYQFQAEPLFVVVGIIISLMRLKREFTNNLSFLVLCCVSFGLMDRTLLHTNLYIMGVFYLVPGTIAYYIIVTNTIPTIMSRSFNVMYENRYFKVSMIIFMVLFQYHFVAHGINIYRSMDVKVITQRGTFISSDTPTTRYFWDTVDYIRFNTKPKDTVVVLPEGSGINYFANRESPLKYDSLTPNFFKEIGEDRIVKEFKSLSVDYVVLVHRHCFEYGYSYFGTDFGKKLWQWIFDAYEPVRQFGVFPGKGADYEFGTLILKRKKDSKPPENV